jgi:hypothetical protein
VANFADAAAFTARQPKSPMRRSQTAILTSSTQARRDTIYRAHFLFLPLFSLQGRSMLRTSLPGRSTQRLFLPYFHLGTSPLFLSVSIAQ